MTTIEEPIVDERRLVDAAVRAGGRLAEEVGLELGADAVAARLRELIGQGAFTRLCREAQTPFTTVLEARP
jgi:hypothetical protein